MADETSKSTSRRARTVPDVVSPTSHEQQLTEAAQVLADAEASKEQTRTPVPVPPPVVGAPDPAARGDVARPGVVWTDGPAGPDDTLAA